MVRELCALYQLLKDNSRRMSSNMSTIIGKNVKPEKYIVGFHDAFRYIGALHCSLFIICFIVT